MQNVHVQYGLSGRDRAHLGFAADLAVRLSARLFVWTHRDKAVAALLAARTGEDAGTREHAHVGERVRMAIGDLAPGLAPRFNAGDPLEGVCDSGSLIVGEPPARPCGGAALLAPMGERALEARGSGEICLPFGNGTSALAAAAQTLGFAAALRLPVLLYHTTWREAGLPETAAPEAHMADGARAVRRTLEKAAEALGVRHRTVVETAATVVEGICRAALNRRCAMIAVARGRNVGRGSYVDGVLARTVVPVFVAGREA